MTLKPQYGTPSCMEPDPVRSEVKPGTNPKRSYFLPRLPREYYQGDAVVLWTLTVFDHATGWLTEQFHNQFRELMLHAAAREGVFCPTYCLMPDHLHLIWMGLQLTSDQRKGMAYLRTYLGPALSPAKFQPQPHDRVLRDQQRRENAFAAACRYVLANPARAGLVENAQQWHFNGAIVPGYPTLHPCKSISGRNSGSFTDERVTPTRER